MADWSESVPRLIQWLRQVWNGASATPDRPHRYGSGTVTTLSASTLVTSLASLVIAINSGTVTKYEPHTLDIAINSEEFFLT